MLAYVIRRIVGTVPVMAVVALFVFSLPYLTPGDPASLIAGIRPARPISPASAIRSGLGADLPTAGKGEPRVLQRPGERFEYNDVRVNLLAACLTRCFGRPLPEVLRERVMGPIGASPDWTWHGYDGADVETEHGPVRAVSGGGHRGGGLFIGSRDHARMGLLMLRDGMWDGHRILPAGWVGQMMAPSRLNADYGLLWWLNGDPSAPRRAGLPADSVFALGAGSNLIWISRSLDLVVVLRWIDGAHVNGMLGRIAAAVLA